MIFLCYNYLVTHYHVELLERTFYLLMQKPNYELKADAISNGFCRINKDISKAIYNHDYNKNLLTPYSYEEALEINEFLQSDELYKEAVRVNFASYKRKTRLQDRISDMLMSGDTLFLTLTFTNEVLENTSAETRRRYVTRVLKKFNCNYVANIDYGKETEREHYHCVISISHLPKNFWPYGFCKIEKVRNCSGDSARLAKYISKLTNHAIKETCKQNRIIYSRPITT